MFIVDDGRETKVFYSSDSSKPDSWIELSVEQPDRKAGTLTVRFPKSKQRYPLKWNAERTGLTCGNPDGASSSSNEGDVRQQRLNRIHP